MRILRHLAFAFSVAFAASPLHADTIGFDDIDATAGDVVLNYYQGYTFTNFSAYTFTPGFPGFNNGIVSGPNAAYSSDVGQISSTTPFDFTGGAFGSGYYDNLLVTIEGLSNGQQLYSQTIDVSTTGAQPFLFSFTGIDQLIFVTSTGAGTTDPYFCGSVGCSYFTLDNVALTPDAGSPPSPIAMTPEPPAWTMLALGLFAMPLLYRRWRALPL